jgi:hypothetical protein
MPSYKFRSEGFLSAMAKAGFPVRADMKEEDVRRLNEELKGFESSDMWICGQDIEPLDACKCGFVADRLCDYPIGDGKTCDLPLCADCARSVGDDTDLCEIHWHEFQHRAGVRRIFPVGPRIVK